MSGFRTEQYEHHGTMVHVISDLKGKHREHCLCYHCEHFKPGQADNCRIASRLYEICVAENMVTPVYECASYSGDAK